MKMQQVWAPWLVALGFAVTGGCGGGRAGDNGGGGSGDSSGGNQSGSGNHGGPSGAGGCTWTGTSWSCGGGSPAVGGSGGGAGATGTGGGGVQPDGGGSGGAPGTGGTPAAGGAQGGDGPSVTITEFPIPSGSEPGAIVTGPDGNLWFNDETTSPSGITRMTPAGMFQRYGTPVT